MYTDMSVGQRLRHFRKAQNLKLIELAEIIGISHGSLSQIETEKTKPSSDTIESLFKNTNINLGWLLSGEGPMLRSDHGAEPVGEPMMTIVSESAAAYDVAGELLGFGFTLVPRYAVTAQAGAGAVVEEEAITDRLAFRTEWLRQNFTAAPADLALLDIRGDSMEPTLADGDMVLIDRTRTGQASGIYVLNISGELVAKRLILQPGGTVEIRSDNPLYGARVVADAALDQLVVVGRVVWHARKMA